MIAARGLAALAGIAAGAGAARADAPAPPTAPDPAAVEAGDANLESTAERHGMTFGASFGGGLMIGFGIKDSVGTGGSTSLRLGHVATPRTLVTLETHVTAALHRPAKTSAIETNTHAAVLVGAQYYANRSLWVRFAGGGGAYLGREVVMSNGTRGDVTLWGGVALFGAGVDLARYKWLVLGFEVSTSAMITSDGVLVASSAGFGFAFN